MPVYADLTPDEAVATARRDVEAGRKDAWDALDRYLRWHLLTYLQDRSGEVAEIRDALLEAADWARQESRSPWLHNWPYLLELLRAGEQLPSTAANSDGPSGRGRRFGTGSGGRIVKQFCS